jgi:hypothetical protein
MFNIILNNALESVHIDIILVDFLSMSSKFTKKKYIALATYAKDMMGTTFHDSA